MPNTWKAHKANWIACTRCPLQEHRTNVVLARGKVPADVLFIGEAPGRSEDVLGSPFLGPAGHLLDDQIKAAGLLGNRLAFTNLVGCIPLERDEDGTLSKVSEPPKASILACSPRVAEFVLLCRPKFLILVGGLAQKWTAKIPEVVDAVADKGITVVDVVHPAAILRAEVAQRAIAIRRVVAALENVANDLTSS